MFSYQKELNLSKPYTSIHVVHLYCRFWSFYFTWPMIILSYHKMTSPISYCHSEVSVSGKVWGKVHVFSNDGPFLSVQTSLLHVLPCLCSCVWSPVASTPPPPSPRHALEIPSNLTWLSQTPPFHLPAIPPLTQELEPLTLSHSVTYFQGTKELPKCSSFISLAL
jgi:hypothetical protein